MEWGKAKTILIITFLVLNVLLGYQLWTNKSHPFGFDLNVSTEETEALLDSKGIRLDQPIPTYTPLLREITVQFSENFDPDETIMLDQLVLDPEIEEGDVGALLEVLMEHIPHASNYKFDPIVSGERYYVLSQLYNELPMFEVNIVIQSVAVEEVEADENAVYEYKQSYVHVESRADEREQRILSAFQAVEFLAENYLEQGSVIRDVSLGYHGQNYDSATLILAPKWRIVLDNGDIYYVHGINGAVEVPETYEVRG